MKLFIDTSNKKIIFATIDNENNVVNFFIEDTNNDVVKNALPKLDTFLNRSSLKLNEIDNFYITIGPGSFTGVKVAYNIISSIALLKDIGKIGVIETFKLIEQDKYDGTIIPFGKSKYYYKRLKRKKIEIITEEDLKSINNINDGYSNFSKELLEEKIKNKSFKLMDNLDKVEIKYLSAF